MGNTLSIQDTTIDSVLMSRAQAAASEAAFESDHETVTFGEIALAAEGLARLLQLKGVEPGDRVALWLPNWTVWPAAQAAIALVGAVAVPVSTRAAKPEAKHIFQHSGSRVVIAAGEFLGRRYALEAADLLAEILGAPGTVFESGPRLGGMPRATGRGKSFVGSRPDDAAALLYTSGTTGLPKGCLISHRTWTNSAALTASAWGLRPDDKVYSPAPLSYGFGSLTSMMGAFTSGASFATSEVFKARTAADRLTRTRATWFTGVPTMWIDLLGLADGPGLAALRGGTWAGAPFPEKYLRKALDPDGLNLNLTALYGMTEALSCTVIRGTDPPAWRDRGVGRAGPFIEVRIIDEQGADVPKGKIGEIVTKGYHTTMGYLKNKEATDRLFSGGWLHTGDLGSLDAYGNLRVEGRLTDMILVGGANVYAREVEDVIATLDGVTRVGVVGKPHDRLGEVPVAWIESTNPKLDVATVQSHCRQNLSAFKVPSEVHFVSRIPLTSTGKVHKAQLRTQVNTGATSL
jgi:acyl-CoA synthetase (AMP-forming)/AMP-acid ligase II